MILVTLVHPIPDITLIHPIIEEVEDTGEEEGPIMREWKLIEDIELMPRSDTIYYIAPVIMRFHWVD